jgi:hypothetical protein
MWTILIIAVATLLTIIVLLKRRDIAYSLVIIWALLGIYLKRSSFDPVYGIKTDIANTALIAIVILVIFIFVIIIGQNSKKLNLFKT